MAPRVYSRGARRRKAVSDASGAGGRYAVPPRPDRRWLELARAGKSVDVSSGVSGPAAALSIANSWLQSMSKGNLFKELSKHAKD
jgi:hypothetical protein